MQNLRVGIIGFGRIGNEHAQWLSQSTSLDATDAYDPTPQRRALARNRNLTTHDTLESLLNADVEIVLVSTPTAMHFNHAMEALAAGKHVMVEKPMAMNLDQSEKMTDLAASANRILSVFHNRRWDLDFLTVKNALDSGQLGRVFNIESRLGQWASCVGPAAKEWNPQWRNQANYGGGGLYDWGSHFIDQIWQLLLPAKPTRVFAQLAGNVWTRDTDDFARICIDFDNAASTMVEINTTTTRPLPRWHIDGTLGSAESPYCLDFNTEKWASLTFTPASGDAPTPFPIPNPGLSEIQIWESFATAVKSGTLPAVTIDSVLTTMKLLNAARESAQTGNAIRIE